MFRVPSLPLKEKRRTNVVNASFDRNLKRFRCEDVKSLEVVGMYKL